MGADELLAMYFLTKYVLKDEERASFWREQYKDYMASIRHYPKVFNIDDSDIETSTAAN